MNKKKVVFLTGTRADYGKIKPLIDKIDKSDDFEYYIFVTGMHTLSKYGSTYIELEKDGWNNIFVYMNQTHTTDMDIILSNTIVGFSNFINEIQPDMIIVHGDRVEALAGAIVGSLNNILVAHIEGGELSGSIDELIRYSVSKLSHIHFVSNNDAKKRLLRIGESKNSIYVIGSPDIDLLKSDRLPSMEKCKEKYEIPWDSYNILIYHPVTTASKSYSKKESKEIVSSVLESNLNYIIVYPNNDAGSDIIFKEYNRLKNNKKIRMFPSIRFEYFLTLLKNSDMILGNSSCGIVEAEVYGIPSINIGDRQHKRTNNKNIINIEGNKELILKSIDRSLNKKFKPNKNFGDGNSANLFFEVLRGNDVWNINIQKHFNE